MSPKDALIDSICNIASSQQTSIGLTEINSSVYNFKLKIVCFCNLQSKYKTYKVLNNVN